MFWGRGRKGRGSTRGCGGARRVDGGGHEGGRAGKGRRLAGGDLCVDLGRGVGVSRSRRVGAVLLPSRGVVIVLLLALGRRCLALKREG